MLPPPKAPGLPELRASAPEWAPFRDGQSTAQQAAQVLEAYSVIEARQALQPGWAPFWQVISAMSDREPFSDEVGKVLRAAGFYGPRTVSRPPEALKVTLEQLVAAQGPSHLGGLLRPVPTLLDAQASSQDQRWQSQLRPDLRRAAPEIYMNFRSE